jgi:hypothetical protein
VEYFVKEMDTVQAEEEKSGLKLIASTGWLSSRIAFVFVTTASPPPSPNGPGPPLSRGF